MYNYIKFTFKTKKLLYIKYYTLLFNSYTFEVMCSRKLGQMHSGCWTLEKGFLVALVLCAQTCYT